MNHFVTLWKYSISKYETAYFPTVDVHLKSGVSESYYTA